MKKVLLRTISLITFAAVLLSTIGIDAKPLAFLPSFFNKTTLPKATSDATFRIKAQKPFIRKAENKQPVFTSGHHKVTYVYSGNDIVKTETIDGNANSTETNPVGVYTLTIPGNATNIMITAVGASGGKFNNTSGIYASGYVLGGLGASFKGSYGTSLQSQSLSIVVGQKGAEGNYDAGNNGSGGGGGSFVYKTGVSGDPLIAAGGGGGAGSLPVDFFLEELTEHNINASHGVNGNYGLQTEYSDGGTLGQNGNGGGNSPSYDGATPSWDYPAAGGGAGWLPTNTDNVNFPGLSGLYHGSSPQDASGAIGGNTGNNGAGGYGGAGAANFSGGGGGGGYSGGGGGAWAAYLGTFDGTHGGGGGSFFDASAGTKLSSDSDFGAEDSDGTVAIEWDEPSACTTPTITGPVSVCANNSITLTGSGTPASSNAWTSSNPSVATVNNTGVVTGMVAGTATITYTNDGGCSQTTTITVNANVTPTFTQVAAICSGGSLSALPTTSTNNITGTWSPALNNEATTTYTFTPDAGQCANTATMTITVNPSPSATITAENNIVTACPGQFVTLHANVAPGYTYQWQKNGTDISGETDKDLHPSTSGNYTVVITNSSNCVSVPSNSITVTIEDVTAPVTPTLANITGECSATAPVATTTDACAGTITGTTSDPLTYNTQGDHIIHWTFTDPSGNSTTADQHVIIADVTPPTVVCPGNISVTANTVVAGQSGAMVSFSATASDNCGTPTITYSQNPGTFFPVGTTTVTVTADDGHGHTATCTFDVTVTCSVATPAISADGTTSFCPGGSVILTSSAATGNVWSTGATTQSITVSATGTYSVTVNDGSCSAVSAGTTVTAQDVTAPVTPTLANITGECSATAPVATTTDACAGTITGTTSDPLTYNTQGDHIIHWTFTDPSGNSTTADQHVIIADVTPPTVVCPGNISVTANTVVAGQSGAMVSFSATASDNCGTPTITYSQNPGTFFPTGTTTVTVTADDGHGHTATCTFDVTVTCSVATPTISADGPTSFCPGGSVTLTSSSATGNVWSTGATTQSITVNTIGSYTVTVSDGTCSASSAATNVIVYSSPEATITASGPTTICSDEQVTLTGSIGSHYLWSDGSTYNSITTSTAGSYTVTITNASGCSSVSQPVSITVIASPSKEISPISSNICPGSSVTLNVVNAPGLTYQWYKDGSNSPLPGQTSSSIVVSDFGGYHAVISNGTCTVVSKSAVVNSGAAFKPYILSGYPTTICQGSSVNIYSNNIPLSGHTFQWLKDGVALPGQTGASISATEAGHYTILSTNTASGCTTESDAIDVTVNPLPVATITAENNMVSACPGQFVTLHANADPGYTYLWQRNGEYIIAGDAYKDIHASVSGIYTLVISSNNCASAPSNSITVTIEDVTAPVTPILANVTGECSATAPVATTTDACAGTITGTTSDPLTYITQGDHVIHWTFTDPSGNSTTADQHVIIADVTPPIIGCPGNISVAAYTSLAGQSGAMVSFSASASDNCGTPTITYSQNPGTFFPVGTTTVTVTADDGHGHTATCQFDVTVSCSIDTPIITANGPTTFCQPGSVVLTSSAVNGNLWSTGETTQSITVNSSGSYAVTNTNAFSGCSSVSQPVSITVVAPPSREISPISSLPCPGSSVTLNVVDAPGLTYQWYGNGSLLPGQTSSSIVVSDLGGYNVVISNGTCTVVSKSAVVNSGAAFKPFILSGYPTTICQGSSVNIYSNNIPLSGHTFQWLKDGVALPGQTGASISATEAGHYTILSTYTASGCTTESDAVDVTVNPLPVATITAENNMVSACPGQFVTLHANVAPGYIYQWQKNGVNIVGETSKDLLVSATGNYSVVITNSSNCISAPSNNITVTIEDVTAPVTPILNTIRGECSVTAPVATTTDACAGTITGTTSDPLTYNTQGDHIIHWTFTDPSGNSTTADQHVIIADVSPPTVGCPGNISVTANTVVAGQSGAMVSFSATASDNCGTPTITYSQNPGTFFPTGTTTVTVTADDGHGHTTTCTFDVVVNCVTPVFTTCPSDISKSTDAGVCGAVVNYVSTASGDPATTYSYAFTGATTGSGNGTGSGSVFNTGVTTVTVTASNICGNATCSFTVTVADTEKPVITGTPSTINKTNDAGTCGAVVTWSALSASDNCAVVSFTSDHHSGDVFPVGTTTVTYTATDAAGNTTTTHFDITVTDNENPVITVPSDVTHTADAGLCSFTFGTGNQTVASPGGNGYVHGYDGLAFVYATATDNCGVTVTGVRDDGQPLDAAYPVGVTTITWTATDIHGHSVSGDQKITITDDENPVIVGLPGNISQSNDAGQCGAVVNWTAATATDNCPGVGIVSDHHSGDLFPIGNTTVTYTATDAHGHSVTGSFTVTITDTEKPVITGTPSTINKTNDAGTCGAAVTWSAPAASDNCSVVSFTSDHHSGDVFPVGTTTVTYTATDAGGNITTTHFDVVVTDNEVPVVTCPSGVTVTANTTESSVNGAHVTYGTATATDNCGVQSIVYSIPSGSFFPVGDNVVDVTVTDIHGNVSHCSFHVVVNCVTPVFTTCPSDISKSTDAGVCGAVVNYVSTASGDPATTYSYTFTGATTGSGNGTGSGSVFNTGVTTVTVTASNICGSATCSFTVTVADTEKPVITGTPSTINKTNDAGACGAVVTWSAPTASDNCSVVSFTSDHHSGDVFSVGTTTVTYTATDAAGNITSSSFDVVVTDNEVPVVTCPSGVTITANTTESSVNGAHVTYGTATATDNCGVQSIVYSMPSGGFFPVGDNVVDVTVTDIHGNITHCSFHVVVNCVTPVFTVCPSNISKSTDAGVCGAVVNYVSTASGDPATTYSYAFTGATTGSGNGTGTGSVFNTGVTTVTVTASNICGSATCSFTVTVADTEKPVITGTPSTINKTNDAGTCGAVVTWSALAAADNCAVVSFTSDHHSGDVFPVGTTTVTYTATDAAGNTTTTHFDITVTDNENPVITVPSDVTHTADAGLCSFTFGTGNQTVASPGGNGYVHGYDGLAFVYATATDNCGVTVTGVRDDGQPLDAAYPVGVTTITWTATDIHGHSVSGDQKITVTDDENPVIVGLPGNISQSNDAGQCGAVVNWTAATATDNCPGVMIVSDHHSGDLFPIGNTTVTYTATDAHGHSVTGSFIVTVNDTEKPKVKAPGMYGVVSEPGKCGATIANIGQPQVSDNCGIASVTNDHPSGFYPVGTTTVTWIVTDVHGNVTDTAKQLITVIDNEKPTITAPAAITVNNDPGSCGAILSIGTPVTADNCGVFSVTNDHPSNYYPVGTTIVTWTVLDIHGFKSKATQSITVIDNEPPVITVPSDVTHTADAGLCSFTFDAGSAIQTAPGGNGAGIGHAGITLGMATATDNCAVTVTGVRDDGQPLDAAYPVGVTTITWTATDIHGNAVSGTQKVTVTDDEYPVIVGLPGNINKGNDLNTCGAVVNWTAATATDNCPGVTIVSDHHSGEVFPLGTTLVTYTATDAHGHSVTGNFSVTVSDVQKPVVQCPADITVNASATNNGQPGANVTFAATASDNCGVPVISYSVQPGSFFPVGTTTVTTTVDDGHGNTATCSFNVTVNCVPPVITVSSVPTSNTFTGGVPTSLYLGYGAQSTVLKTTVAGSGNYSYAWSGSGAAKLNSTTGSAPLFTPTEAGSYQFTVVATNGVGCQSSGTISICVTDIRVPGNMSSDDDDNVDDHASCDHKSHSAKDCPHKYEKDNKCDHKSHSDKVCPYKKGDGKYGDKDDHDKYDGKNRHDDGKNYASKSGTKEHDDKDDHHVTCDHKAHSAWNCPHRYEKDNKCDHKSHSDKDCPYKDNSDKDDHHVTCDHKAHSAWNCPHRYEKDNKCDHKSHSDKDCPYKDKDDHHVTCDHKSHSAKDCPHKDEKDNKCDHKSHGDKDCPYKDKDDHDDHHEGDGEHGQDNYKVFICHVPPGNPSQHITLSISINAVAAHLANHPGDRLGSCEQAPCSGYTDLEKPVISCPPAITVDCSSSMVPSVTGKATATDNSGVVSVTYTDTDNQGSDANAANYYNYTITRTWKATDPAGNTSECSQMITVRDQVKPVINCPGNVTLTCAGDLGTATAGTATATDNSNGPVTITYNDRNGGDGIYRTWTATDASGNYATCTQKITVRDDVKPVITAPADVTAQCGTSFSPSVTGTATATDNCSAVSITYSDYTRYNVITRTWKATDASGNYSTDVQKITIVDNVKPVITAPADKSISCGASTDPKYCGGTATGTDGCSDVTISYSDAISGNVIVRTWKATDASGNYSTAVQNITIIDNGKPVITDPRDITISCGSSTAPTACGSATATDNCSSVTVTYSDVTNDNVITRTWKATDAAGNYSTSTQKITIVDNTKPVITDVPDITVSCNGSTAPSATGTATATDACSDVTVTYSDVVSGNKITRTWKATDAAGNYSTSVQTITQGAAFDVDITSVPTSSTYTGGVSTNLYLGYGAQSTTLQTNSLPSGGAPYTYNWSGSYVNKLSNSHSAAPVFTPATFGYYTFSVQVTNKYGCTSTESISICVTDIRVPGCNGAKVYVCHTTSGKYGKQQTLEVPLNQVSSHIGSGYNGCGGSGNDRLGSCDQSPCNITTANSIVSNSSTFTKEGGSETVTTEEDLNVVAMPNPSTTYFTLKVTSRNKEEINMRVLDAGGRVIDAKSKIVPNSTLQIGQNYSSGTYYAELIQGTRRKVVQLIKGRG